MRTIIKAMALIAGVGILIFLLGQINVRKQIQESPKVIQQRIVAHEADLKAIDEQWAILHRAYKLEEKGDYEGAIALFEKAFNMGDKNVPSLALQRVYEKVGQYDKALEITEWLLKGNQNEQGRQQTLLKKAELVKKLEEQKKESSQVN